MNNDTRIAGVVETANERRQRLLLADDIEATLGGHFETTLRDQANRMRSRGQRYPQHLLGRSHLEIERLGNFRLQPRHIVIADMTAILAKMRGDAIGAGLDDGQRGANGIGTMTHRARYAAWQYDRR